MIKINGLINKDGFIKDQYKRYCEKHFKIELYSLNFFLNSPYYETGKTKDVNDLSGLFVSCDHDENPSPKGRRLVEMFTKFVEQIKSGEKVGPAFRKYIKDRDYFLKRDENGALVDILVSFEFLMDVRIYYFEC